MALRLVALGALAVVASGVAATAQRDAVGYRFVELRRYVHSP